MNEQNLNDILSGGGLSALLQNPEIAAKLPRIMEALAPVMAEMKGENIKAEEPQSYIGDLSPKPKAQGASARRCTLLRALEPYLSDKRREATEYIIKVSTLIDMLSEVK